MRAARFKGLWTVAAWHCVNPEGALMKVQPQLQRRLQDWRGHEEKLKFITMWQGRGPEERPGGLCWRCSPWRSPCTGDARTVGWRTRIMAASISLCDKLHVLLMAEPVKEKLSGAHKIELHWATYISVLGFCVNGYFKKTLDILKRLNFKCVWSFKDTDF